MKMNVRPQTLRELRSLLLIASVLFPSAQAGEFQDAVPGRRCPDLELQILAANAMEFHEVCTGARDALTFFAELGLQPIYPLRLEIVPRIPEEAGPDAVGCYLEQRKLILMLSYPEFRQHKTWFKLPIGSDLYRSLAAHEAAHALAAGHFTIPDPTLQAKEYIASVAMFATMSPSLRAHALHATPGKGFDSDDQITATFYMFDPIRFGAESYRHYLRAENGPAFLHSVLAGRKLAD